MVRESENFFVTVKLDAKDKIRCHMNDDMECQDKIWHII